MYLAKPNTWCSEIVREVLKYGHGDRCGYCKIHSTNIGFKAETNECRLNPETIFKKPTDFACSYFKRIYDCDHRYIESQSIIKKLNEEYELRLKFQKRIKKLNAVIKTLKAGEVGSSRQKKG